MLVAWQRQAITWTNVDLSPVRSSDIHLRASSQEIPQPSITEIIWKIKYLNLSGANELKFKISKSKEYPAVNFQETCELRKYILQDFD